MQLQQVESLPWQSEIPGQMHCCGHDGHMAVLLAVAEWIKDHDFNDALIEPMARLMVRFPDPGETGSEL